MSRGDVERGDDPCQAWRTGILDLRPALGGSGPGGEAEVSVKEMTLSHDSGVARHSWKAGNPI